VIRGSVRQRLGPLGERGFRLFITGYATSVFGSAMTPVAVTFAVLDAGGGAADVGYVLAAETIPLVVFLLAGGVVADRFSRRAVMLASDLSQAASQLSLAVLVLTGRPALSEFMVLLAVLGAGLAVSGPAMTGLIPEVVSAGRLQPANALVGLAESLGSIGGPAVAGVIVALANPGWAILADALTYLVSAWCLGRLQVPAVTKRPGASFRADLAQGWVEFRARTWLWSIVGFYAIFHLIVLAPYMVLGAVIAKADLGGSGAWGAILAATGVGGVAAGLVMLRYRPARPLVVAQVSSAMMVVPIVLLVFRAPVVAIALGACLSGAGGSVFGTLWTTTMQREIPPAILSRVSAYDWFGSVAFLPLGYALVGVLSATLGINGALWLAVGWFVAGTAALLAIPGVRALRDPAARPAPAGQASTTSKPAA